MTVPRPISRRSAIRIAAAAAATLVVGHIPARAGRDLAFQVIGDWGFGSSEQRRVANAMAEVAQACGSDFVISTGDNFYPRGIADVTDTKFETHFESVYDAPALQVPWHIVLGNHDHKGNVQAQIDYSAINPRWSLPARYYKRTEKLAGGSEADFFFIDTDPIRRGYARWTRFIYFPAGEQIAWLERELAASRAPWKIVVGHHPLFSGGYHRNTVALIELLEPLFERYGVQVYLNGHNHNLEHVVVGDVHYLTSGGGSRPTPVKSIDGVRFVASRLGFMHAALSASELTIEFFDDNAEPLYRATIPVNDALALSAPTKSLTP